MRTIRPNTARRVLDPLAIATTMLVSLAAVAGGQLDTDPADAAFVVSSQLPASTRTAAPMRVVEAGGRAVLGTQSRALGLLID